MCTFLSQSVWEFSIKNQNYAVEHSLKQANKFDVMVSVVDSYQKRLLFKYNKKPHKCENNKKNETFRSAALFAST